MRDITKKFPDGWDIVVRAVGPLNDNFKYGLSYVSFYDY